MRAKCIKPLRVDGYQFEEGKEYDMECQEFTREHDGSDPVLARGHRVCHLRYAVKYDLFMVFPFSTKCREKVPITLFLYDRQYCEHENCKAPAIDPLGLTSGGQLLCFDDFFEEVTDRRGQHVTLETPTGLKPMKTPWAGLKPMKTPWSGKEVEEIVKAVWGDKAEEPVVWPSDMPKPTRMDWERWQHEMLHFPRQPRQIRILKEDLDVIVKWCNETMKVMPPIDPDELREYGITIKAKED